MRRCFACGRKLGNNPYPADTRDGQFVFVGSECYKLIKSAGGSGYQPPKGGPKLWLLSQKDLSQLNNFESKPSRKLSLARK